jgi:hypothetical protein
MRTLTARLVVGGLVLMAAGGCGGDGDGDGDNGPDGGSSGPFTAVVDGTAWAADELTIAAQPAAGVPGTFVIVGSQVVSPTDVRSITLSLYNVRGTGTYALGVLPNVIGGIGTYGQGGGSSATAWVTPLNGYAGTLTLTALTASRIAGTFAFDASDNASSVRHVTQGAFDVPLNSGGTLPTVPDNAGGRVSGTVGGAAYNASLVAITQSGASGVAFSTTSDTLGLTISLTGVTATGTYDITTQSAASGRYVVVNSIGASPVRSWGTGNGTSGSVVVTSLTATRVRGTFTATLGPQLNGGATTPLTVSGDFDVGLP